jgi:hypothetical protein
MGPLTRWMRLRSWLAGGFFLMAGYLDPAYDVRLDDAPPRHPKEPTDE